EAIKQVLGSESASLVEENRRLHRLIVEGVDVEFHAEDGAIRGDKVRLIDFDDPDANDWLVVDQMVVIESGRNRRPDVVVFL
ncbi:type I restriction endonuclease, partial [Jhaorihella thermophila]